LIYSFAAPSLSFVLIAHLKEPEVNSTQGHKHIQEERGGTVSGVAKPCHM